MGLGRFSKAASKTTTKAKKDDKPRFAVPELSDAVDQWLEAKKMQQDGKSLQTAAENSILDEAESRRLEKSLDESKNHGTVVINDKIMVSAKNAYSAISEDSIDDLKEIFGDEVERFFKEKTSISFSDEALKDETLIDKIADIVGDENIDKFFVVKQCFVTTDAFHDARSTDSATAAKAKEAMDSGLVKPHKSAVRKL